MAGLAELGRGRWQAAAAAGAEAASLQPAAGLIFRAATAAAPFSPLSESRIEEIRARLAELAVAASDTDLFNLEPGIPAFYRDYLLGLLSVRLGDLAAARRYAAQVDEAEGQPEWGSLVNDYAWTLRAWVAWTEGRPADALAALENVRHEAWYGLLQASPVGALTEARFLRGEALAALDRPEDALGWFRSVEEFAYSDVAIWGPTYLREAEIYEVLGDRENAALYYRRLIDLWQDCDPELRPRVEQAERALARLTG